MYHDTPAENQSKTRLAVPHYDDASLDLRNIIGATIIQSSISGLKLLTNIIPSDFVFVTIASDQSRTTINQIVLDLDPKT